MRRKEDLKMKEYRTYILHFCSQILTHVQVLHLFSGRSLLFLPLTPGVHYADSNRDGVWEEVRFEMRHKAEGMTERHDGVGSKPRSSRKCYAELLV